MNEKRKRGLWESSEKHENFETDHLLKYDTCGIYTALSVGQALPIHELGYFCTNTPPLLKHTAQVLMVNYSLV